MEIFSTAIYEENMWTLNMINVQSLWDVCVFTSEVDNVHRIFLTLFILTRKAFSIYCENKTFFGTTWNLKQSILM